MIYSLQAYIEDYLSRRNIQDDDGYAIRLTVMFYRFRSQMSDENFISKIHRIHTTLFKNNRINRLDFELTILKRIDANINKTFPGLSEYYSDVIEKEKDIVFCQKKLTMKSIITGFKHSIESKSIDLFWESRKEGKLRPKAEKIAQGLFTIYTSGEFIQRHGIVLREVMSGVGYVDCMVIISSVVHLVEIKILKSTLTGTRQLEEYMRGEQRNIGNLLVIDALRPANKITIPEYIDVKEGRIYIYAIDINPNVPSSLN